VKPFAFGAGCAHRIPSLCLSVTVPSRALRLALASSMSSRVATGLSAMWRRDRKDKKPRTRRANTSASNSRRETLQKWRM